MNKRITYLIGIFLIFTGGCMTIPLITALAYKEHSTAGAFIVSIFICVLTGWLLRRSGGGRSMQPMRFKLRESYLIVTLIWIIMSVAGSFPYLFSGIITDPTIAFFENCSAFTTTGATSFADVESLPRSILLWISMEQWLGGMGIIVLVFALLPRFGVQAGNISQAETTGPVQRKFASKYNVQARRLYLSYIALTGVLFVLLMLASMSPFDALAHSFTTMATGGFSTHNAGLAYFDSPAVLGIIAVFAFISGSSFVLIFDIFAGRLHIVLKDEEYRGYLLIIGFSTVVISVVLYLTDKTSGYLSKLCRAFFEVVNTISTLGYKTAPTDWPSACLIILVGLMIMGGCSSSTAGGIKISRLIILLKTVRREIRRRIHGSMVSDVQYNRKRLSGDTMAYALSFFTMYVLIVAGSTLLIGLFGGGDPYTNFLTVLSCISSLGPGLDNLGLLCEFHFESTVSTIVYSLVMIAGRLELTTILVLFSRYFWQPDKA